MNHTQDPILNHLMRLVLLPILITVSTAVYSQVKFYASTDARQIVAGHYFEVSFVIENARGQFKAPSFLNFDVVGGPNTSTQMSIVNGRSSQKVTYSYTLTTHKVGKYTIDPAEIMVNGQTLKTEPLQVEVLQGTAHNSTSVSQQGEVFLQASIDHTVGHVGQQITLRYDLYTTLDIRSYNFASLPAFDGFFAQDIQNYNGTAERVVREGVQYVKKTIKVIALFPQQKGAYTLEPAKAVVGISTGRSSNSFFFNRNLKQQQVTSPSLSIDIVDLPSGKPSSFAGAVGHFDMTASVDKKSITQDDALTLTLQVRGIGDGKFIEAPQQPFDDQWDIYEPNLLHEEYRVVDDKIEYTKTFEYLMTPKVRGKLEFRPEFAYYNTDSAQYAIIEGELYQITVLKGTGRELADINSETFPLTPVYTDTRLKQRGHSFAFSRWHGVGNISIGLAALALLLAKRRATFKDNIDPAILRNERAQKLAIATLIDAKKELDRGDVTQFYIQLRKGLTHYLADKTNLASDQLSKSEIQDLLQQHHLTSHLDDILLIMQKGEQAIYASIRAGDEDTTYQRTVDIIREIESSMSLSSSI